VYLVPLNLFSNPSKFWFTLLWNVELVTWSHFSIPLFGSDIFFSLGVLLIGRYIYSLAFDVLLIGRYFFLQRVC
jgi:hypothetical protein